MSNRLSDDFVTYGYFDYQHIYTVAYTRFHYGGGSARPKGPKSGVELGRVLLAPQCGLGQSPDRPTVLLYSKCTAWRLLLHSSGYLY